MATTKQQEVAPAKKTEQSVIPTEFLSEIVGDAGAGVSDMGMDDVAVPYLYILQAMSPQVNEDHDSYVKGARPGMFYNNVTGEIFDGRETGLTVIPCAYERKYVEWRDRDNGPGGYVADHDIDSGIINQCKLDDKKRPVLPNGNLIIETAYHYCYILNPITNVWEEIIIPMKSTALKKSRRWNKTLMSTFIPSTTTIAPRWLYPYNFKTVKESRGDQTWSNFDITRLDQPVTVEQYRQCKNFAELIRQGLVQRAAEPTVGEDAGATIDGERAPSQSAAAEREGIPF